MALNGAGLTESIVHANRSAAAGYVYRNSMGMVPSAEFLVSFDDFNGPPPVSDVPWGWLSILDSGATITASVTAATGNTGVLVLTDATASEGAAIYKGANVQLTVGKRAYMEVRVLIDATITDTAFYFGWTALTDVTNPEDLWDTSAADLTVLGITDGSAVLQLTNDTGNAGLTTVAMDASMVAATWTVLAIGYDGATLRAYKDGQYIGQNNTTIPVGVALAPFFGHINGNGATGDVASIDYWRMVIER